MIPRKFHAVWFGSQIPPEIDARIQNWKRLNPGFELKIWNEKNSPTHLHYLQTAIMNCNWANASNLVRLWALAREGGIYMDTDVDVYRSFQELLREKCFLGFQSGPNEDKITVNNAIVGAEAQHPFIESCLGRLLNEFDGTEPANYSSPDLTTSVLWKFGMRSYGEQTLLSGKIRLFPQVTFNPYKYDEINTKKQVSPGTITVHRWHKTWSELHLTKWEQLFVRFTSLLYYFFDSLIISNSRFSLLLLEGRRNATLRRFFKKPQAYTGLFRGVHFNTLESTGSALAPKIAGTYEWRVQQQIGCWTAREYEWIFFAGCECGHDLTGLAKLFVNANLMGWDTNELACQAARDNTSQISHRIKIWNKAFDWADIPNSKGRSLLLCDIEGGEWDLFNRLPERLPSDFIIELHHPSANLPPAVENKIKQTHHLKIIEQPNNIPVRGLSPLTFASARDLQCLTEEGRPYPMRWLAGEQYV